MRQNQTLYVTTLKRWSLLLLYISTVYFQYKSIELKEHEVYVV